MLFCFCLFVYLFEKIGMVIYVPTTAYITQNFYYTAKNESFCYKYTTYSVDQKMSVRTFAECLHMYPELITKEITVR